MVYPENELEGIRLSLTKIAKAFEIQKLKFILVSKEVSHSEKAELLVEISENKDPKFANFVKQLVDKKKIEYVASMAEELRKYLAKRMGSVNGVVTANFHVSDEVKLSLEKSLSHKLGKSVELQVDAHPAHEFDGIKVVLDDISVEV
jgi:F0F1-type ATP synthase delta subunit